MKLIRTENLRYMERKFSGNAVREVDQAAAHLTQASKQSRSEYVSEVEQNLV